MRKPEETPDNFTVKEPTEPPAPVSLRSTDEFEVLSPLVGSKDLAKSAAADALTNIRPSWFEHSLALVVGAFAMIALILVSAVVIGFYDTSVETAVGSIDSADYPGDRAIDQQLDNTQTPTEEPLTFESFSPSSPLAGDPLRAVRSVARRGRPAQHVLLAAYRPPRRFRRPPVVTKFVPTTLVIYAEHGEIKRRIEPQLTASYKKPVR